MTKPASPIRRRLAAIFCADVAAYARLMSIDETGTLYLLNAHNEVLNRQITQHNGRTANTAGDSIVAEFPSAVDAVRCALDVQERIAAVNEDVPQERRVVFRIGVHVGEVMIRNGDIFGDGVNIAARMEKLAQPGLICLSGTAHEYVRRVLPLNYDDLGPQVIKNLSTAIQAYMIHPSTSVLSRTLPPVHRHNEFNLGRRFDRVLTTELTEITKPERLTVVDPAIFASLHDAPGITERRLAERIGCDLAIVQRMVKHLEHRELICRSPGAGKHPRLFSLTPAGLELYTRLHPAILAVRDRVMATLSEQERASLQEMLGRVISANEARRASH
ncbi:adenylate/guanylate cyclase domain-containing protein [Microvirga sp. CF3016]|uniref:adenylate/guanylate cyclase domain-containing protein n=1 Tax=Microvirga sp. CF3016 TaxID=3110181 RepID=UPI002E7AADDD|nr:adenylate/guanylate cyclase domain-containing protein [Microvirga sp. CF3016]MEE1614054.1 adenylate/guanylate cyclase domain-containing protein [Microvirga sp. CF3016]